MHFLRNAFSLCSQQRSTVLTELKTKVARAARFLEEQGEEMLAVHALPEEHRKCMRTANMLESQNEELETPTRVARVLPSNRGCLRLAASLLMEIDQAQAGRSYLNMWIRWLPGTPTLARSEGRLCFGLCTSLRQPSANINPQP